MFKKISLTAALACCLLLSGYSQKLVGVDKGYSNTSVNTTVFRSNSLVTFKGYQYIAYYDADQYLVLGKRKLNKTNWEIKRSPYKGNCRDAHNIISFMIDGDGYLSRSTIMAINLIIAAAPNLIRWS